MNINRLKGAVYQRGLTLEELASQTGIPRSTIWRNFKANNMSLVQVKKIKDALRLTNEEVLSIFFEN